MKERFTDYDEADRVLQEALDDDIGSKKQRQRTKSWLSTIWKEKEIDALSAMSRAVICGCGNHGKEIESLSEFYEITPPDAKEARIVWDYTKP